MITFLYGRSTPSTCVHVEYEAELVCCCVDCQMVPRGSTPLICMRPSFGLTATATCRRAWFGRGAHVPQTSEPAVTSARRHALPPLSMPMSSSLPSLLWLAAIDLMPKSANFANGPQVLEVAEL